jgi:DNA modification methylase
MRFAYADPPYPGQSAALYGDHPDFAGEIDHAQLLAELDTRWPDGWALSTSAVALAEVLALCPPGVRVAAWYKSNSPPIRSTGRWIWTWEPVIVRGGRLAAPGRVRDALYAGVPARSAKQIPGQKPEAFTRWMLELLGAQPGDTVDDLFSGSGAVQRVLHAWQAQGSLALWHPTLDGDVGRVYSAKSNRTPRAKDSHNRGL